MAVYLTEAVAQRIVQRAMAIIGHNINVMDRTGIIIGSGDLDRLHQIHEGALKVLDTGTACDIGAAQVSRLKGVQTGINRPIRHLREIVGVVGVTGDPDKVSAFADLVVMTAELMIENAVVLSEVHWDQRQRENLVTEIIRGTALADDLLAVRANKLKINLDTPRIAIALKLPGDSANPKNIDSFRYWLDQNHPHNLMAMVSSELMVVLHKLLNTDEPSPLQAETFAHSVMDFFSQQECLGIQIAVGNYQHALDGLAVSWQSASETLQLGMTLQPNQSIYYCHEFQMDAVLLELGDSWKAQALCSSLQPLLSNDKNGVLQKTLRQYINCNADSAATVEIMHIHRNTLGYRLEKIQLLTGLNPRQFNDLMVLHSALRLVELQNCADA